MAEKFGTEVSKNRVKRSPGIEFIEKIIKKVPIIGRGAEDVIKARKRIEDESEKGNKTNPFAEYE